MRIKGIKRFRLGELSFYLSGLDFSCESQLPDLGLPDLETASVYRNPCIFGLSVKLKVEIKRLSAVQ